MKSHESMYEVGKKLYSSERFKDASTIFDLAIGLVKDDLKFKSKLYVLLGECYSRLQDHKKAIWAFTQASIEFKKYTKFVYNKYTNKIKESDRENLKTRKYFIRAKIALSEFVDNQTISATETLKSVSVNYLDEDTLYSLFEVYATGDKNIAENLALRIIEKSPECLSIIDWIAENNNSLGRSVLSLTNVEWIQEYIKFKFNINEKKEEEKPLTWLKKKFNNHPLFAEEEAVMYYKSGELYKAIDTFKNVKIEFLRNSSSMIKIFNICAKFMWQTELKRWADSCFSEYDKSFISLVATSKMMEIECDFISALAAIEKACEMEPNNVDLSISKAQILFKLKKYSSAYQNYLLAYEKQKSFLVFEGLMMCSIKLNNSIAKIYADEAFEELGKNSKIISLIGIATLTEAIKAKKSHQESIRFFEEAIKLDPKDSYPIIWKAYSLKSRLALHKAKETLKDYEKEHICPVVLAELGFLECELGDFGTASTYFKRAEFARPNFPLAIKGRGYCEFLIEYYKRVSYKKEIVKDYNVSEFEYNFIEENEEELPLNPFKHKKILNSFGVQFKHHQKNIIIDERFKKSNPPPNFNLEDYSPYLIKLTDDEL
ncbi:TPR-like protein [Neoconidiobolus thromboides FSU 785]|nr:TPR-like protein [Neoconidiobolus thromboides FSU 785]